MKTWLNRRERSDLSDSCIQSAAKQRESWEVETQLSPLCSWWKRQCWLKAPVFVFPQDSLHSAAVCRHDSGRYCSFSPLISLFFFKCSNSYISILTVLILPLIFLKYFRTSILLLGFSGILDLNSCVHIQHGSLNLCCA